MILSRSLDETGKGQRVFYLTLTCEKHYLETCRLLGTRFMAMIWCSACVLQCEWNLMRSRYNYPKEYSLKKITIGIQQKCYTVNNLVLSLEL